MGTVFVHNTILHLAPLVSARSFLRANQTRVTLAVLRARGTVGLWLHTQVVAELESDYAPLPVALVGIHVARMVPWAVSVRAAQSCARSASGDPQIVTAFAQSTVAARSAAECVPVVAFGRVACMLTRIASLVLTSEQTVAVGRAATFAALDPLTKTAFPFHIEASEPATGEAAILVTVGRRADIGLEITRCTASTITVGTAVSATVPGRLAFIIHAADPFAPQPARTTTVDIAGPALGLAAPPVGTCKSSGTVRVPTAVAARDPFGLASAISHAAYARITLGVDTHVAAGCKAAATDGHRALVVDASMDRAAIIIAATVAARHPLAPADDPLLVGGCAGVTSGHRPKWTALDVALMVGA